MDPATDERVIDRRIEDERIVDGRIKDRRIRNSRVNDPRIKDGLSTDRRIHYLCYRAARECSRGISQVNQKKLEAILTELRDFLRLRIARVREMAAILAGPLARRNERQRGR
jgi:hypothetical protein